MSCRSFSLFPNVNCCQTWPCSFLSTSENVFDAVALSSTEISTRCPALILAKFKHAKFNTHIENSNHRKKMINMQQQQQQQHIQDMYRQIHKLLLVLLVSSILYLLLLNNVMPFACSSNYLEILKSSDFWKITWRRNVTGWNLWCNLVCSENMFSNCIII